MSPSFNSAANHLTRASGALATAASAEMEQNFPWYRELGAQERSWVGLVAQAGIQAFIEWNSTSSTRADESANPAKSALTTDVFGAAPRELTRVITFEQTVALVRTTIDVVESSVDALIPETERQQIREAILRYSREIAFSAAEVYARAAEARGAWDARLEALVIDALIRDAANDEIMSQASALGWSTSGPTLVMAGATPDVDAETALSVMRRAARNHSLDLLTGIQGTVMFAVISGSGLDENVTPRLVTPYFGPGPVMVSDLVSGFASIGSAARACASGIRAASAWPEAPRPVHVAELLPERSILGDPEARNESVQRIFQPLAQDPALLHTVVAYLDNAQSLEATSRKLFVHSNTVRYRLKRVADITGFDVTNARDAFAVRIAIVCGLTQANAISGPPML